MIEETQKDYAGRDDQQVRTTGQFNSSPGQRTMPGPGAGEKIPEREEETDYEEFEEQEEELTEEGDDRTKDNPVGQDRRIDDHEFGRTL